MDVVKFLLEKGAKLDHADKNGVTSIWIASNVCTVFSQINKKIEF